MQRAGAKDEIFIDAEKHEGPYWKIMSDDKEKLILFKELDTLNTPKPASVHSIFFIDKKSGDFRYRNYVHTEYINTVRGECLFK